MKRLAVAASILLLIGAGGALIPGGSSGCTDPGSALPVVLVHGFSGRPSDFDVLDGALSATGVSTTRFDYSAYNLDWVTKREIAPALGTLVECLASRSEFAGGPGKVAVVAHSMGGLAVREASRRVGDRLGFVVTIGTPHEGSLAAGPADPSAPGAQVRTGIELVLEGACSLSGSANLGGSACGLAEKASSLAVDALRVGSPELAALPAFPSELPVLAIAGDVTVSPGLSLGDTIVSEESATAFQAHTELGGGTYVVRCDAGVVPSISAGGASWPGSECLHRGLLENPRVIDRVIRALQAYPVA